MNTQLQYDPLENIYKRMAAKNSYRELMKNFRRLKKQYLLEDRAEEKKKIAIEVKEIDKQIKELAASLPKGTFGASYDNGSNLILNG